MAEITATITYKETFFVAELFNDYASQSRSKNAETYDTYAAAVQAGAQSGLPAFTITKTYLKVTA